MKRDVLFFVSMATLIGVGTGPVAAQQAAVAEACGKQWTIADTNNDLALTPEEAEASRDIDFARLDQNGDGNISEEEWALCNDMALAQEALGKMEGQAEGAETQAGLVRPDVEADKTEQSDGLTREELAERMKQKYAKASEAAREAGQDMTEEAQAWFTGAWFRLHDVNADGKVSPEELAEADLGGAHERAFQRVDLNDDGIITKAEYGNWITTRYVAARETASGGVPVSVWHYYVLVD